MWPVGLIGALIVSLITYGALTTAGPPRPAIGGAFGPPTSSPSFAPSASPGETPTSTVSPGASGTPTAGGSPAPTPSGVPSPKTVAGGFVVPTAGAYTVRVEGHEGVRFSAFGFCNRDFPATTTLHIKDQYAGRDSSTSYEFDIAYSSLHSERHIYRYTKAGVFLEYEFAQVSCAGRAQSTNLKYSTPQQKVELPIRVGATWSGSGGDADRTETYHAKVLRKETLLIAGRSVETFVIETSVNMTGKEHGTRLQRWWFAPSLGLPVRTYEKYDAAQGPASYQAEITVTFADLDPR